MIFLFQIFHYYHHLYHYRLFRLYLSIYYHLNQDAYNLYQYQLNDMCILSFFLRIFAIQEHCNLDIVVNHQDENLKFRFIEDRQL